MKRPHLVAYDYGMGAVWAYVLAESAEDIVCRYAKLQVVQDEPAWMTDKERRAIRERMTIDIDNASDSFLSSMRKGG